MLCRQHTATQTVGETRLDLAICTLILGRRACKPETALFRYFISAFLIHLDDADEEVQSAVLAALQELRLKKPAVLKAEVCKVYDSFRSKHLLDLLVSAS